jgi:hypothetical protein
LALVVVGHAATLRAADDTWRSLWEDAERRGVAILSAGSGAEVTRDALFSFRADGTGVLNVAMETSVPEAVVDLAESEDDEEEEEEMRDDDDDKALAIATTRSRPVSEHLVLTSAVTKRGRVDGAFAASALPSKRLKPLLPEAGAETGVGARPVERSGGAHHERHEKGEEGHHDDKASRGRHRSSTSGGGDGASQGDPGSRRPPLRRLASSRLPRRRRRRTTWSEAS